MTAQNGPGAATKVWSAAPICSPLRTFNRSKDYQARVAVFGILSSSKVA